MVDLAGSLSHLGPITVLVIGDLMLDAYTIGEVKRVSPEAPVTILNVTEQDERPGGAGNVMLNLRSLGCEVVAVGRVGEDRAGHCLVDKLAKEGVDVRGVFFQESFVTPVKNRIIASQQQIVRVDHEKVEALPEFLQKSIEQILPELLMGVSIVAVSDYAKGLLSKDLLQELIFQARKREIPVVVDPKGADFSKYRGATVVKPNLKEARIASGLPETASLDKLGAAVLEKSAVDALVVTRSGAGISLFTKGENRIDFPARVKEVNDVTGAGDTVLSTLTVALGNGLALSHAIPLTNIAAGIAVEQFGCARVTLSQLARRLFKVDAKNKIFQDDQTYALEQAFKGKSFYLLGLNSAHGLTTAVFKAIRHLAETRYSYLGVYLLDGGEDQEFVKLLASLSEVSFVILASEGLQTLCYKIHPEEVYTLQHGSLQSLDHAEALFTH